MKGVRVALGAVFILAVVLEGWAGVLVGASAVVVGELIGLRWRLSGPVGSFAELDVRAELRRELARLGRRLRRRRESGDQRDRAEEFPGLQREYDFGSLRGFDVVLRPRLIDAAEVRLSDRHGVDIYAEPERARPLLGGQVWPLLDPSRPAASHADGGRVSRRRVANIVRAIEEL